MRPTSVLLACLSIFLAASVLLNGLLLRGCSSLPRKKGPDASPNAPIRAASQLSSTSEPSARGGVVCPPATTQREATNNAGAHSTWCEDSEGQKHGVVVEYDAKGRQTGLVTYDHGTLDGDMLNYSSEGQVVSRAIMKRGMLEGRMVLYWPNGRTKEEGQAVSNWRQGRWVEWYESGAKMAEGSYLDDERDGEWMFLYEDGSLLARGRYTRGRRVGRWVFREGAREDVRDFSDPAAGGAP